MLALNVLIDRSFNRNFGYVQKECIDVFKHVFELFLPRKQPTHRE